MGKFDRHVPSEAGNLPRQLRSIQKRQKSQETVRRLEAATIGRGGLRVKDGGQIEILDANGDVAMTLAADELTLAGILTVVGALHLHGSGDFIYEDDEEVERFTIGTDADGNTHIQYFDSNGTFRALMGTVWDSDGQVVRGQGFLVDAADGMDIFVAHEREATLRIPNRGRLEMHADADEADDSLALYDADGNLRALLGQVFSGETPVGYGLLLQQGDGTDVFVAREGRLRVDTADGGGEVTLGAPDSGGTGFRVLRIPN